MAFSKNGWSSFNEIEFESSKIKSICDGFDNAKKINRHYQKTIFQQYKVSKNLKKKSDISKIPKPQKKKEDQKCFPEESTLQYFSTVMEKKPYWFVVPPSISSLRYTFAPILYSPLEASLTYPLMVNFCFSCEIAKEGRPKYKTQKIK